MVEDIETFNDLYKIMDRCSLTDRDFNEKQQLLVSFLSNIYWGQQNTDILAQVPISFAKDFAHSYSFAYVY